MLIKQKNQQKKLKKTPTNNSKIFMVSNQDLQNQMAHECIDIWY